MMMAGSGSEADRSKISGGQLPPPPYGTFSAPTLPQPVAPHLAYPAPPKALQHQQPPPAAGYHAIPVGYQSHPFPALVDGVPMDMREPPLPFCGIGVGWALFIAGFFFASIPWYVGAFILLFVVQDYREKPGLVACTIAAVLALVPLILNAFDYHIFW